ncbi:AAA family ATPase, partial [Patescibacteria group bacterium]|nr:AAA family ATPase [Patescibacteria group bacterium]
SISNTLEEEQQSPEEYLKSKGINDSETMEKFDISITKHFGTYPAIKFKIPTGFKYRRFGVEPKYMHAKGAKSCIFKSEENNSEIGYVNEGEIDSIVLNKYANIPAWCASTGGKSQSVFRENLNEFESFKKVYLLYHTDKTGKDGARDVTKILGTERCYIVECPAKDWSDYFVTRYTKEDFQVLLDEAKPAKEVFEIYEAEQEIDKADTAQQYLLINNEEFLKKDFPKNPWLVQGTIRLKGFTAFAGPGGTGKSVFVIGLIKSVTEGTAWLDTFEVPITRKVLLIDRENDKENIQSNLRSMGVTSNNLYHALLPPLFHFLKHDEKLGEVLSDEALRLRNYVIDNNIEVVALDSFVDFFEGNENDPVNVAKFAALCQEVFPDCCVILLNQSQIQIFRFRQDLQTQ